MPLKQIGGILEGSGCLSWKGSLEADFDLTASELKSGIFEWENRGLFHCSYSSKEGVAFSGLDFCQAKALGSDLPNFSCKVDLLSYDPVSSLWSLRQP